MDCKPESDSLSGFFFSSDPNWNSGSYRVIGFGCVDISTPSFLYLPLIRSNIIFPKKFLIKKSSLAPPSSRRSQTREGERERHRERWIRTRWNQPFRIWHLGMWWQRRPEITRRFNFYACLILYWFIFG